MDFDCDYNAPMYCDFTKSAEGEEDLKVDKYFDVDHENNIPSIVVVLPEEEGVEAPKKEEPKKYGNILKSWDESKTKNPSLLTKNILKEAKKKRHETPERRSLRKAVAKTIENVSNSPKLVLTKRTPRRSNTSKGQPRLVVATKAGSSSRRSSIGVPSENGSSNNSNGASKILKSFKKKCSLESKSSGESAKNPVKTNKPLKAMNCGMEDVKRMAKTFQNSKETSNPVARTLSSSVRVRNRSCDPSFKVRASPSASRSSSRDRTNSSKYVSMAEAIRNMELGVPDRFHTLPNRVRGRSASPKKFSLRSRSISPRSAVLRIVMPRSPRLITGSRSRPGKVMSSQEILDKEIDEIQKHQFKARAVGEGVKPTKFAEVEQRQKTIPQPFNLTEAKTHKSLPEEHIEAFKARPVPKTILSQLVGVPEKKVISTVKPVSPSLATKERVMRSKEKIYNCTSSESIASISSEGSSVHSQHRVIKARPVPHFGIPNVLPPKPKKQTKLQPFSFDEKLAIVEAKKRDKFREILEQEKRGREFKANPLPNFDKPVNLPMKEHISPTKCEPFNLDIEKRVEYRLKKWEEGIELELRKQKEAANFKARPLPEMSSPAPLNKPLVEISNIKPLKLHTDRRAQERDLFEMKKKEKETELLEQKRLYEDQKKRQEEEEIRRIRQESVHKSNPIRYYAPIKIHPSDKPATEAHSPEFVKRTRTASNKSILTP